MFSRKSPDRLGNMTSATTKSPRSSGHFYNFLKGIVCSPCLIYNELFFLCSAILFCALNIHVNTQIHFFLKTTVNESWRNRHCSYIYMYKCVHPIYICTSYIYPQTKYICNWGGYRHIEKTARLQMANSQTQRSDRD